MADSVGFIAKTNMKWQIALAVGLPVVVGVGYWCLIKKGRKFICSSEDVNDHGNSREVSLDSDTTNKVNQIQPEKIPLEEATILKEEGNKCFKSGKYDEAISYYEKAIECCPKSEAVSLATFYQNKAAAYEQLQNYDEVKTACSEALSLNPKYTKALLRRAKAHEQTNELSQAFEDLTAACILENFQSQPTLISADRLLQELGRQHAKEAMAKHVPLMPSTYFIHSYFSSFANDPIQPFLTKTDGDFSRGFLKAIQYMRKKEYESVIPACTEEIDLKEGEALYKNEALLLRGTFYQFTGDYTSAISDLTVVIDNEEADVKLRVNALIKRACVHMQLEKQSNCLQDFQKAIAIDSGNSDIYHHRGQINLLMEKIQEASDDFKLATSLNPKFHIPAVQKCYTDYRCALLLRDENKLHSVMQNFEKIISEHPECADGYFLYAQVLSDQQEFERADALYQKALKVDSKNATILVHRALLKLQWTADIEAAIKLITEALELDDRCGVGYETLGTIEVQRGNFKKAIEMFDKAINLAKTEFEISHLFSLKNAAVAQKTVLEKMNIQIPRDLINTCC